MQSQLKIREDMSLAGADLEISKGGFFLLLWLAGHSQPYPLSIVFLAKGGVLPNFENNRRTPLDPLVPSTSQYEKLM